jgi:hypothetical protein
MRRICLGIAGGLLAVSVAGCGEPSEEGPISYKGTTSPGIEKLRDTMAENAKGKSAAAKGMEDKSTAKKDKDKGFDKKSAAEPAADKKKD